MAGSHLSVGAVAEAIGGERTGEPAELALQNLRRASEPAPVSPPELPSPVQPRFEQALQALSSLSHRSGFDQQADAKPLSKFGFSPENLTQETELQRVERLVKRLADEVKAKEQANEYAPSIPAVSAAAVPVPPPLPMSPAVGTAQTTLAAEIPAVGVLDPAAAQLAFDLSSAIASLPKWPEPAAEAKNDELAMERREAILSALHSHRIDVFLEPILGLNDQRPQHYEVSIGLRGEGGETLNLAQAASSLSGTGLLPLIDSARIAKAAHMARRLAERGKAGAVLTEFSAESLLDRDTQADLTGRSSAGAFPGQLVLMLPQAQVRLFSAADWQTLARLNAAGFGFALTDVTSLDMDFAALAGGGFTFARLDAETFLVGLPTSDGQVEASGICRHIAASGLTLVVGGIVDDLQLAKIFGFGVLFGQGQLFGGPRPVSASQPQTDARVASAAE